MRSAKPTRRRALVNEIKTKIDDPESGPELDAAQQAFNDFREAQATLAGNMEARGGSLFGAIHASAAEDLTLSRIEPLQSVLNNL